MISTAEGENEAYKGMHLRSGDDVQVKNDTSVKDTADKIKRSLNCEITCN